MVAALVGVMMVVTTLAVFLIMARLYRRFPLPFLMPALTTTFLLVIGLLAFNISYDTYMIGGQWIDHLLGPAVVSLAYPLYRQRHVLARYLAPILTGVLVGSMIGMASGLLFAKVFGFSEDLVYAVLPKSVTTPVAMQITSQFGGAPSLAVIFVMVAGYSGVVFGPYLLKAAGLHSFIGKGMGMGAASHAIGTAKAYEFGEDAASVSSIAMTLSAISGSVMAPFIVWLFY
ncbi:LrgB family protein [Thalassobacillus sp. CUG 92003]|uniref:LrgB family protein n=1 Tax=Thalassobacillus sp. CUG 92003 TaxID=2736641 RepID=UPI0015E76F5B|nr:LrgB family protein [Thalassobacillus sp. CUG 92003]